MLLDEPALLGAIVAAVRRAVPAHLPVSAKMRLGNLDGARALDAALAIADAGACELVVHARTKLQGYKPPAYWPQIRAINEALRIAVVANGEIWTVADAQRARMESGCQALMLGRGQVADPGLAWALRAADGQAAPEVPWAVVQPLLARYWANIARHALPKHRAGRLKQWLQLLRRRHPEAQLLFEQVRCINDAPQLATHLFGAPVMGRAGQGAMAISA